jgi:hypothetical protein
LSGRSTAVFGSAKAGPGSNGDRGKSMKVFQIRQIATGAILWTGGAEDETRALDAMAREAGFDDRNDLPEDMRSGSVQAEAVADLHT